MFAQRRRLKGSAIEPESSAASNPWLARPQDSQRPPAAVREVRLGGPEGPQRGVAAIQGGLPITTGQSGPRGGAVGVLGCSGGSGESSLAQILDGYACQHAWPAGGGPIILCARTTATGLQAAQAALTQWVAGAVTADVLGLAVVEDTPGRRPKPLQDLQRTVGSGAPQVWQIPWIAQWRNDRASVDSAPRQVQTFITDVQTLLTQRSRRA